MNHVASRPLSARLVCGGVVFMTAAMMLIVATIASGESGNSPANPGISEFKLLSYGGFKIDPATAKQFGATVEKPSGEFLPAGAYGQAAVHQSTEQARQGPDPKRPFFKVRFALPIPPDNSTNASGSVAGLDPMVLAHNHSPGFEILPNGDALAIYFSAKNSGGASEREPGTRFVQARLRFGAEQWDPPELFFDSVDYNDQSGLLWADGNTIRFFGGGRDVSPWLPFRMATSTDNGATWTFSLPLLDKPAADCTPQPVANAFRGANGGMLFAMDGEKDNSFLWRSTDGGVHWQDMGGRTGARHSTIVPLDDQGHLLSIGGKNAGIDGWSPMNTSENWGATWSASKSSAFPALGGNQRPNLIRLANGHLCFVTDSYHRNSGKPPEGWKYGAGCVVAISTNNGSAWHIKPLPVTLPHEKDKKNGTLGYATVRQGPDGMIHLLATMTDPCLHYEFNEAWVFSDVGEIESEARGGKVQVYREKFSNGSPRVTWSAKVCPSGRYLLDGVERSFYENGKPEHEATYSSGRKSGRETFWSPEGKKIWSWEHDLKNYRSVLTSYWPNGRKRVESTWNTKPESRDVKHRFDGLVADGPMKAWRKDGSVDFSGSFVNGEFGGKNVF